MWIVYPTIYTIIRSFYGKDAHEGFLPSGQFVGIDNYKALFTTNILVTAIKNSAIWILVAPALVTAIGLVFAVLTERIRWAVAFKTIVFMPMAISLFATGVIWHLMYIKDPSQGAVNAGIGAVEELVVAARRAARTRQRRRARSPGRRRRGFVLHKPISVGWHGAARPDGDPADRRPVVGEAGCRRRRRRPARSRASSGATSSPAAARPARSSTGARHCPA